MIVITRNGETTVLTGWREWLVKIVVFMAAILLFAIIVFLMFGLAVTIGAIALVVIPAAIIVALLGSMFGTRG
ncbi:MAG TPA: hypothetical protein VIF39_03955 [Hyphomicrobium sp.]|jgi:hypothetical protein